MCACVHNDGVDDFTAVIYFKVFLACSRILQITLLAMKLGTAREPTPLYLAEKPNKPCPQPTNSCLVYSIPTVFGCISTLVYR